MRRSTVTGGVGSDIRRWRRGVEPASEGQNRGLSGRSDLGARRDGWPVGAAVVRTQPCPIQRSRTSGRHSLGGENHALNANQVPQTCHSLDLSGRCWVRTNVAMRRCYRPLLWTPGNLLSRSLGTGATIQADPREATVFVRRGHSGKGRWNARRSKDLPWPPRDVRRRQQVAARRSTTLDRRPRRCGSGSIQKQRAAIVVRSALEMEAKSERGQGRLDVSDQVISAAELSSRPGSPVIRKSKDRASTKGHQPGPPRRSRR